MNLSNYDHRQIHHQQVGPPRHYQPHSSSSNGGGNQGNQRRFGQIPSGMLARQSQQVYHEEYNDGQHWEEPVDQRPQQQHMGGGGSSSNQTEKPTGLRHFSTKVCEKVKEKGLTNYNEVADELVADYFQNNLMKQIDVVKQEYDMKNIRRRVYDALNVLLAMNIITKNKKDIRWIGLPASASQEISRLEEEKTRREASIRAKKDALSEMIMQIVSYKNLIARNRNSEHKNGRPPQDTLLHLPFLIINTDKDTNVECSVSSDKSEFLFSFDKKFEIHDDFEVLKKLNLTCGLDTGTSTEDDLKVAKGYLPRLHQHYVDDIVENHQRVQSEKEERKQQMILMQSQQHLQQQAQLQQQIHQQQQHHQQQIAASQHLHYYDEERNEQQQQMQNSGGRFNRQLQEHLHDGDEDTSAAAAILERDDDVMMDNKEMVQGTGLSRGGNYGYSPQRMRQLPMGTGGVPSQPPATTKRYYVQKAPGPIGQIRREMSPAIRQMAGRPYPPQGGRVMSGGGSGSGGPVKYYVPPGGQSTSIHHQVGGAVGSAGAPRYIQRVRPQPPLNQQISSQQQHHQPQQRVVYSSSSGIQASQLAPGQRIVTQRVVTPGGPHPPGTIIRKVIRKIVVNNQGQQIQKQSPAQQVIQKKMMEQEMMPKSDQQPMTSAQAAAMIQHPPPEEFDYFE